MMPASAGPAVSTIWKLSRSSASPAARQQAGHERAAGRAVDGDERGLHGDEGVEQPDQPQPGDGLGGERRRHRGQAAAGDQHELAPVHGVGDRAAEQPHRKGRHHLRHAEDTDRERRVGEVVNLKDDGKAGQGAAYRRQGRSGPQPPERGGLTQRRDIREQPVPVSQRRDLLLPWRAPNAGVPGHLEPVPASS
jgi:hypothetical protein